MFKRPNLRTLPEAPKVFVSHVGPNGAIVTGWSEDTRPKIIPTGTPGRVGEIATLMSRGLPPARERPWRPHPDYEKIALHMPECERPAYLQKCRDWYEAHPPAPLLAPKPLVVYDNQPILKLFQKYHPHRPPFEEHISILKQIGYPENLIEKCMKKYQRWDADSEKDQELFDRVFGKSAPVKKVIKVVKKKMK